jgi:hypothetical protein
VHCRAEQKPVSTIVPGRKISAPESVRGLELSETFVRHVDPLGFVWDIAFGFTGSAGVNLI